MSNSKKLLQAAAGSAGGAALNVEDVFSTYLYTGNGTSQTITNDIDLAGEGGLMWFKRRDATYSHHLYDTEVGVSSSRQTDTTIADITGRNDVTSLNSNGFSVGSTNVVNASGSDFASWTFRKAPKFFDVVTYTGNGVSGRTISHNLGCEVGCIIVKQTSSVSNWPVYHRSLGSSAYIELNSTNATTSNVTRWYGTDPTSTDFTVNVTNVNKLNETYVAYLFAHNDGDGEFGSTADQDIIKCGSYTGSGSTGHHVDLGFEPQWILVKESSASGDNWILMDSMRGLPGGTGTSYNLLFPNLSNAEASGTASDLYTYIDATGFGYNGSSNGLNQSGETYIYIAIRRGPMAVPESATDVFDVTTRDATHPSFDASFDVVDMAINRN